MSTVNSIHESVWLWIQTCPYIKDLFFNFGRAKSGDTVLVPLTSADDIVLTQFINGASERRYTFSLVRFDVLADAPNDTTNLEILFNAGQMIDWIRAQAAAGNYPQLPEGCVPYDMAPAETGISPLAAQDESQAKYIFQFTIDYLRNP